MSTSCIKMESEEYGADVFKYFDEADRIAGLRRLLAKAAELQDGVERHYYFVEMDDDGELVGDGDHVAAFDGEAVDFSLFDDADDSLPLKGD